VTVRANSGAWLNTLVLKNSSNQPQTLTQNERGPACIPEPCPSDHRRLGNSWNPSSIVGSSIYICRLQRRASDNGDEICGAEGFTRSSTTECL
jgi:hypothetical protein